MSELTFAQYIDPGSGSMILQLLLGGLAAAAVFLKIFWHRLLVFLRIRKPSERREEPVVTDDASELGHTPVEGVREAAGKR